MCINQIFRFTFKIRSSTLVCSSTAALLNQFAKVIAPPPVKNLQVYPAVKQNQKNINNYYRTKKLLEKLITYHSKTEKLCIVNIHSINFSRPQKVSSFCIRPKMFSTNCLSNSSRSERAVCCVGQDASSMLMAPAEFKGAGFIVLTGSGFICISRDSAQELDFKAFSLDSWASFLTLERWPVKKSRT